MSTRRVFSLATLSMVLAAGAACTPVDDKTAMKNYLDTTKEIAQSLGEAGAKLDTLMNTHANAPTWTEAERTEIKSVNATMKDLLAQAKAMTVPTPMTDIHPLLIQGVTGLVETLDAVSIVAEDPAKATPEMVTLLQTKPAEAQQQLNQYLEKLQKLLEEKYPDLLKE